MDPHPAAHRLFLQPDTLLGVLTAGRHSVWQKTRPPEMALQNLWDPEHVQALGSTALAPGGRARDFNFLSQWMDTCWPLSEPPAGPSPRPFCGRECSWEGQPGFPIVPTATPLSPPCRYLSEMDPHMHVCICCLCRGNHTCLLIHTHTTCKHTYTIYTCPREHVTSHVPTLEAGMHGPMHHTCTHSCMCMFAGSHRRYL